MLRAVTYVLLLASFVTGVLIPGFTSHSWGGHAHGAKAKTGAPGIVQASAGESHSKHLPTEKHDCQHDCDCPAHRAGCGHASHMIFQSEAEFSFNFSPETVFAAHAIFVKAAPLIEGPFQPPRA